MFWAHGFRHIVLSLWGRAAHVHVSSRQQSRFQTNDQYTYSRVFFLLRRVQLDQEVQYRRCQITFGLHCAWLFRWWADLSFTGQLTLVIWINLTPFSKQSRMMMAQWQFEEKTPHQSVILFGQEKQIAFANKCVKREKKECSGKFCVKMKWI